jgi:hypothetical protein
MEELKQKIIDRIDMIEDKTQKRTYLGDEYDSFLQMCDDGIYTEEQMEKFTQFVNEQKVRIQNFISSPIEDENIV